jgi:hypothetical protein
MKSVVIEGKSQRGFERDCKFDGDCFVAGTLVHTDKGLVPIEHLQVGDMVLSLPENGQGEKTYKKVLDTFKSQDKKQIYRIHCAGTDSDANEYYPQFFATKEHPFYVFTDDEWSWVALENLQCGDKFKTFNNTNIYVVEVFEMYTIEDNSRFSWSNSGSYNYEDQYPEIFVDFERNQQIYTVGEYFSNCGNIPYEGAIVVNSEAKDMLIDGYQVSFENMFFNDFYANVYNFSVEDNHAYFVGKAGILAHNICDQSKRSSQ